MERLKTLFNRDPLFFHQTIPVFSNPSEYIENYEKIGSEQIELLHQTGKNPWIPEDEWCDLEKSTEVLIKKYSKPGNKILDVGVGLGRLLSCFPELEKYGMDICFALLKESKAKEINVCYSLIEDIPYSENSFDIIVCTDVLEHVLDLNDSCKKILSCLKPGGIFIIRTPYNEDLNCYLDPNLPYKYVHLRTFNEATIYLLFLKILNNCTVNEITYAGYQPKRSKLRYHFPLLFVDYGVVGLFLILKRLFPALSQSLMEKTFFPLEINAVIQKKY